MSSLLLLLIISIEASAFTFAEMVIEMSEHQSVKSLEFKANSLKEEGTGKGSWGDPVFKIVAKNFPKETLNNDQSPMTGIEFGVSQKIALTPKYGKMEAAFHHLSQSKKSEAEGKRRELLKNLWILLISRDRLEEQIGIIKENITWLSNILKVSKRLYANGRSSQQALLDIKIRKSELDAELNNRSYEIEGLSDEFSYLVENQFSQLDRKSIPWTLLDKKVVKKNDTRETSFKEKLAAKKKILVSTKLSYVPDLTISFGYTKRSNIDGNGDFVSASVSFPLPFSGKKYSDHFQASYERRFAENKLINYQRYKDSESRRLTHEIERLIKELQILNEKTIVFAESSRTIASKSYSLGSSSYMELLQSELKLQSLLFRRSSLNAKLKSNKVIYKLLIGDDLHE